MPDSVLSNPDMTGQITVQPCLTQTSGHSAVFLDTSKSDNFGERPHNTHRILDSTQGSIRMLKLSMVFIEGFSYHTAFTVEKVLTEISHYIKLH